MSIEAILLMLSGVFTYVLLEISVLYSSTFLCNELRMSLSALCLPFGTYKKIIKDISQNLRISMKLDFIGCFSHIILNVKKMSGHRTFHHTLSGTFYFHALINEELRICYINKSIFWCIRCTFLSIK